VVDSAGRRAWTNPFILQGSQGSEQGCTG
jgi:hypothetical protein